MAQIQRQENRPAPTNGEPRTVIPAVDVYDSDDHLMLVADFPGVRKEDLTIEVDHRTLLIEGRRGQGTQGIRFRRQFHLPDPIDSEKISADCAQGVLQVRLPYRDQVKPRRIEITG